MVDKEKEAKILHERMQSIIKNLQPKREPPYTCPKAAYGEVHKCQFPNCLCEWKL